MCNTLKKCMHRLVGGSRGAYGVVRAQSHRLSYLCVRLPPTSTTRMNAGLCVSTDGHMPVFNLKDSEAHLSLGTKTTSLMKGSGDSLCLCVWGSHTRSLSSTLLPCFFFRAPLLKPNSRNRVPLLFRGYWGT